MPWRTKSRALCQSVAVLVGLCLWFRPNEGPQGRFLTSSGCDSTTNCLSAVKVQPAVLSKQRQSKVIEVKSVVVLFVGFLSSYIQILSSAFLNLPKIKSQNTHNTIKDRFDWFHVLFSNVYRYLIDSVIGNFFNCDNHVVKIEYCDKTLQKLTKHYQQNVNK